MVSPYVLAVLGEKAVKLAGEGEGLVGLAALRVSVLALTGRAVDLGASLGSLASAGSLPAGRARRGVRCVDVPRQIPSSRSGIDGNLTYCAALCQVVWFATEMAVKAQATGYASKMGDTRLRIPVRLTIMEPAEIGRRIRTARAWAGISQDELGELLEVSEATIRRMEQGLKIPRSSDISYICQVCGVRRDFFTDDDPGLANLAEEAARAAEGAARRSRSSSRRRPSRGRGAKGNPAGSSERLP